MKSTLILLPLLISLAGCVTQEERMLTGAAAGMAVGAAVSSDDDRMKGALIGGAVGLAAGTLIGRDNTGRCIYQRRDGSRYYGAC